jgi:hypothetical protein
MYIAKQPHVGGEVTPHQDSTFIYTTPETCVAFWWPVEAATVANSCIWVIPVRIDSMSSVLFWFVFSLLCLLFVSVLTFVWFASSFLFLLIYRARIKSLSRPECCEVRRMRSLSSHR